MGDLPLRTPNHRCLGRPLLYQLANVTHAHPQASHLVIKRCLLITTSGVNPPFGGLSRSCGKVAYALLTRAPVVSGASSLLPLDLHVLGLSLAFILSQDQTLRCIKSFLLFFSLAQTLPSFISKWNWWYYVSQYITSLFLVLCCLNQIYSKITFFLFSNHLRSQASFSKASAKIEPFLFPTKCFDEKILKILKVFLNSLIIRMLFLNVFWTFSSLLR